ncbi:hypothetical protein NL676_002414 [Syzygium grande]|nr:hypothetical protein NL676_002414 [Syzygium grande]
MKKVLLRREVRSSQALAVGLNLTASVTYSARSSLAVARGIAPLLGNYRVNASTRAVETGPVSTGAPWSHRGDLSLDVIIPRLKWKFLISMKQSGR